VKSYILVLIFYTIFGGVGLGIVYAVAATVVNFYFERFRVVATVLSSTGSGLGIAVLPAIVHHLLKNHEWDTVLIMYACFCAALAVVCLLLKDLKPELVELPENKKVNPNLPFYKFILFTHTCPISGHI
jgi:MFS family permease